MTMTHTPSSEAIVALEPRMRTFASRNFRNVPPFLMDADDFVQAGQLRVLRDLHRFDAEKSDFETWAMVTAKHGMLDALRSSSYGTRNSHVSVTSLDKPVGEDGDDTFLDLLGVCTDDEYHDPLTRECLERAFAQVLTPKEHSVLELVACQEMSMRDVGELYGVTESRISQVMQRVRNKLRDHPLIRDLEFELA